MKKINQPNDILSYFDLFELIYSLPYKTLLFSNQSLLLRFGKEIFPQMGESPLTHAQACLKIAKEDPSLIKGTEQEYTEIITLLQKAQVEDDTDRIDRCCTIL